MYCFCYYRYFSHIVFWNNKNWVSLNRAYTVQFPLGLHFYNVTYSHYLPSPWRHCSWGHEDILYIANKIHADSDSRSWHICLYLISIHDPDKIWGTEKVSSYLWKPEVEAWGGRILKNLLRWTEYYFTQSAFLGNTIYVDIRISNGAFKLLWLWWIEI